MTIRTKHIYFSLLVMFTGFISQAQNIKLIGIENGLSNNTVTSIYKDQTGLMWFGTNNGLNRFDGFNFKVFNNQFNDDHSLPDDAVTCINADNNQNIWAGTRRGLGVLNNKTLKFDQLRVNQKLNGVRRVNEWVYSIQRNKAGDMYIGTRSTGLLIAKSGSTVANQVPLLKSNGVLTFSYTVTATLVVNSNEVWAAVEDVGLCKIDLKTRVLKAITPKLPIILTLLKDHNGGIFIGTFNGLFYLSPANNALKVVNLGIFTNAKVNGLLIDRSQSLWVMTDGHGILKVRFISSAPQVVQNLEFGKLTSSATYCMYEDELSRLWVGTLRGGIDIINDKSRQFSTYRHNPHNANSLVNDFTFSFCEDNNGNVWIGTDGGGLSIWNRRNNSFKNYVFKQSADENFNENFITSIIKGPDEKIWLSTYGPGVRRFNPVSKTLEKINFKGKDKANFVWKLFKDNNGTVWAITLNNDTSSLYKFNPEQNQFVFQPFKANASTLSIADDGPENLWLGTSERLLHCNKRSGIDKIINLNCPVRSLHISKTGELWIGTYGRGLFCYDKNTGRLKNYTEANGLCNNKILNIEEDNKGNLWISTEYGLAKFDPQSTVFENFYASDGLQSNQFYFNASLKLSSGELIFGGIKGFSIFNPDNIHLFHDFPPLVLTGIRVANTPIDAGNPYVKSNTNFYNIDHITLPYNKAILSLDFVALEYSLPEKIQFAYMLQGKDKTWNNLFNQHSINYSQLDEGNYLLKIRSTNSSGIWNPREKLIYITITPPWYRTWEAYTGYLLFFISVLITYLRYHHGQTKLKFEIKLVKELNEKKVDFFTNIAHELRTPLTLIVNPVKELLDSSGKSFDLIDISTVYRNSRRLLSLVDQLLLFRKSENDISPLHLSLVNLNEVCHEVFLCFINEVKLKHISYSFIDNDLKVPVLADREKLDIVLFNLLSNAIKYTPEHGSVSLIIKDTSEQIEITIADTGIGIPLETGDKLFEKFYRGNFSQGESGFGIGLFLARRYMELHKGAINYASELGKGSQFTITLPKPDPIALDLQVLDQAGDPPAKTMLRELIIDTGNFLKDNQPDIVRKGLMTCITDNKQSVLLVDDNSEFRNYLKKILGEDYLIYEAEDVEKGFAIIEEYDPDIVVSDVLLKGISGVEFCSKLKESPSFSHIPVILLTGSSSPEIKLKGIECGAVDYITKPFENELLIARIKSTLTGRDLLKKFFINEITLKQNQLKVPAEYSDFIAKCINIVERHLQDEAFDTKQFTVEIGMSRSKLFRNIKSVSGLNISEFIRYIRLRKAGQLMIETDLQIKEIAYKVGFNDQKNFREQFHKLFEMNPSDFVRKYKNSLSNNKSPIDLGQIVKL